MALATSWTTSTASFFHHVKTWECHTFWNHIIATWQLKTNNLPTSWDHIQLPRAPELPKSNDQFPTQCLERPHTLTCYQQKHLAYLYFHKPKTCLKQNTSQTRLRTLSSTSPWSYEKLLLFWNHYSNKLFSLSLHCHHTWKIDWLERTSNWKYCIHHHSPQVLAHIGRTTWPNKVCPFHPHRRQICFHISKINCSMQWPWN